MTTALESRVLPKVPVLVQKYGTLAEFTLYAGAIVDTDNSTVAPGAPTIYQRYITPPQDLVAKFADDGSVTEREGVRFFLPSGATTADPLPFTPTLGLHCTVRSRAYRVTLVQQLATGDQLAGYMLEARA